LTSEGKERKRQLEKIRQQNKLKRKKRITFVEGDDLSTSSLEHSSVFNDLSDKPSYVGQGMFLYSVKFSEQLNKIRAKYMSINSFKEYYNRNYCVSSTKLCLGSILNKLTLSKSVSYCKY
jgi:hypothetical protein